MIEIVNVTNRKFNPGDVVKHFKRETNNKGLDYLYVIIGIGRNTVDDSEVMIYQALYGKDHTIFVRPYDEFMSEVDHKKYPKIKQKYRFELA